MEINDHMNGFNSCIEIMLDIIDKEINKPKSGDLSINDTLRSLRHKLYSQAFHSYCETYK